MTSEDSDWAWDCLVIPAIAPDDETYRIGPGPNDLYRRRKGEVLLPDREPKSVLDDMKAAIGSMTFAAQYQQNPVPAGGNVIKREWLKYFAMEPASFDCLVVSWDTASTLSETSSYSVGMLWGQVGTDYYVLEIVRGRWEAPDLRRIMLRYQGLWKPDATLIEDTELGRSLRQDVYATDRLRLLLRRPRYGKEARLLAQSARFEAGQVHVATNKDWTAAYVSELLAFPFGRSDDQVDATSQALDYLTASTARCRPIERRNIERRNVGRRSTEVHEPTSNDGDEEQQPPRFRGPGSIPADWPHV